MRVVKGLRGELKEAKVMGLAQAQGMQSMKSSTFAESSGNKRGSDFDVTSQCRSSS